MSSFTYFTNQTTDGPSAIYEVQDGGFIVLKATGTFGGATISIQIDFGDDDFAALQSYQFTTADAKDLVFLKPGMRIQAALSGSTGTTSVSLVQL